MVAPDGEAEMFVISHQMSAAFDILTDGGFRPGPAAEYALAAERLSCDGTLGHSPEEFARHLVKLRRAVV
jgi:hypothetical protein